MILLSSGLPITGNGSRRGYNAKKRSEAAQIAAQNGACVRWRWQTAILAHYGGSAAQLMPNVSYTPMGGDKGKQKAADGEIRRRL